MGGTDRELLEELAAERGCSVDELVDAAVAREALAPGLVARELDVARREAALAFEVELPVPVGSDRANARRGALLRAVLERQAQEGSGPAVRRHMERRS